MYVLGKRKKDETRSPSDVFRELLQSVYRSAFECFRLREGRYQRDTVHSFGLGGIQVVFGFKLAFPPLGFANVLLTLPRTRATVTTRVE